MAIISLIIFGFVVGLAARFFMPGRDNMGFIATTLLGILGAVVGSYLGSFLGFYAEGSPAGFIMATLGAMVVLFVFNAISSRK
ncbi:MAG: GlsB/YeaQ/YmgE family stress response membrane protein [Bdellovibrionales bacterium]